MGPDGPVGTVLTRDHFIPYTHVAQGFYQRLSSRYDTTESRLRYFRLALKNNSWMVLRKYCLRFWRGSLLGRHLCGQSLWIRLFHPGNRGELYLQRQEGLIELVKLADLASWRASREKGVDLVDGSKPLRRVSRRPQ
jgi:hypothetical protein